LQQIVVTEFETPRVMPTDNTTSQQLHRTLSKTRVLTNGLANAEKERSLARDRARAYDEVYTSWHAKRITIESFENHYGWFLDSPPGCLGCLNGNEIDFVLKRIGTECLAGKTILDYCCGTGRSSIYFALLGARVCACDRSTQAIRVAMDSARLSGVADKICFAVVDVQEIAYPTKWFDAVFCQSALHIIVDYPACADELARVVKSDGSVFFCEEALGHNPLFETIRWFRRRRYASCGGKALTYTDIHRFGHSFAQTHIYHFNLLLQIKQFLGEAARYRYVKCFLRVMQFLDSGILKVFPFMRRFCGKVVVEYVAGEVGSNSQTTNHE